MRSQLEDRGSLGARFDIIRQLGAGGMGIVFEAYDQERDIRLALKTLKRVNAESLLRFKNEFRSLADIKHPNLVTLYELISDDEQWFFTMELIHGVDLLSYVCGVTAAGGSRGEHVETETASLVGAALDPQTLPTMPRPAANAVASLTPPPDPALLAATMGQLVAAIRALHASGHLHQDIKPSNILVTPTGRVVVLDFGVVRQIAGRRHAGVGDSAGTPAYMAPEQARAGVEPSPASDWYSVGVTLYAALAGQRPFRGSARQVLEDKQARDPPWPSAIRENVDANWERVAMGLLRRDPSQRFDGEQILRVAALRNERVDARAPAIEGGDASDTAMVGRERHLTVLREAFAKTKAGSGATVHIHGRSGMGKSTLVTRFLEEVERNEAALVLAGRCYERESVPYEAMDSLVDDLCGHLSELPRHDVDALLPLDVASLARAFPVLRRVEAIAQARRRSVHIASDPLENRKQVFSALRELLARLSQRQPLVLFIDDLQWGDIDSAGFLVTLMEPPTPPLLFLISYRSEAVDSSPILRLLLSRRAGLHVGSAAEELRVLRLSLPEGAQLAAQLLDYAGAPLHLAERISRESGGNPFFIQEFVRFVASSYEDGNTLDSLELSALIAARVDTISPDARALLELIAVAAKPISHEVGRRAAALEQSHPLALAELSAANLIRTTGMRSRDLVECFHDRIRETVAGGLSATRLAAAHLRIARGIESSDRPDSESLAVHFAAAGERAAAFEHAVVAADAAAEALAFARSASLYDLALQLQPEGDQSATMGLGRKLGDALVNAGRGAEAAAAYQLAAEVADPQNQLQLRVRAGAELLRCGRVDAGLDVLKPALEGAGLKMAAQPWRAVLSLLLWRLIIRVRGLAFKERSIGEILPQNLARIDAIWAASSAFGMADSLRGADIQTRHLLRALRAGDLVRVGRALAYEGAYASLVGPAGRKRAARILASVESIAARTGESQLQGAHQMALALAAYQCGEWPACIDYSQRSERIYREQCVGATWELTSARLYQIWALHWQGRLTTLTERVDTLLREARERGDVYSLVNLSTGLPSISGLVADDPQGTRQRAEHARGQWSREGYHLQHYWTQLALAQADLYAGDCLAAHQRADDQWQALKRMFFLRIAMVRCEILQFRARCAVAAAPASDRRERLLAAARRDAKRLARERLPWCAPAAALIRAGIERTRDHGADVDSLLAGAAAGLHEADTHAYATVAEWHRGRLLGGDKGRALVTTAEQWMSGQGVANPERFSRFYAPGLF